MGITHGGFDVGVAQDFLQGLGVGSSHGEMTCKGVAQIFNTEVVNPCPSKHSLKINIQQHLSFLDQRILIDQFSLKQYQVKDHLLPIELDSCAYCVLKPLE